VKKEKEYRSLIDFYPFYKHQHQGLVTRVLHFFGTGLVIVFLLLFVLSLELKYLGFATLAGYGFAWFGQFFFEKNKPATFQYPVYRLDCDFGFFGIRYGAKNSLIIPKIGINSQKGNFIDNPLFISNCKSIYNKKG